MLSGFSCDCHVRVTNCLLGSIERSATKAVSTFCVEAGIRVRETLLDQMRRPLVRSTTMPLRLDPR